MSFFKHRAWSGVLALVCILTGLSTIAPIPVLNGQAFADTGPDLVIDSISWTPEVPALRDTITFTVTVSNLGDSAAPPADMDYYIDDCLIDTVSFDAIPAGGTSVKQFTWQALAGDHTIKAIIDSADAVAETNEDNNIKNYVFPVIAADLIIESITWSPQVASLSETVTFSVEVKNQGNQASTYTHVEFFVDDSTRGQRDCGQLEPGESKTFTYPWIAQVGQHTLKATADVYNQSPESDETNNDLSLDYYTAAPDLIITSIKWSPVEHTDTENVTIHITVKNVGAGIAQTSRLDFYADGIGVDQIYFQTLYPGYYDTKTISWFPGVAQHTLSAVIDASNWIYESNDSNNTYSVIMPAVSPPDLVIDDITWTPDPATVNSWMTYTITVRNAGGRTVSVCYLDFYISPSYRYNRKLGPILPGGTATATINFFTSDAPFKVRAIVDPGNLVAESDETNNELEILTTLTEPTTVDFLISNLTYTPKKPAIGEEITITTRLKNNSTVKAELSHLAYLVDGEIIEIIPIRNMNAKNTLTNTITWVATPGTHTIQVIADYNDAYYETNEDNNTKEITISVLSPDLAVQSVTWSPESPAIGDSLAITFTIVNQGTYKSSGCYIDYYVDGVWTGDHYIGEIEPGDTVTRTLPWTLTNEFHSFRIIVDKDNDVMEDDESNNEKTAVIPAPDLLIESITCSPDNFTENDTVTFIITVVNAGATPSEASYLDCYINEVLQASLPVNSIPAGSSAEVIFEWTALSGYNTFKVSIDGSDDIVEVNETNNVKSIGLETPVQTDIEVPPEAPAGDTTDNATSNETQEVIPGILDDDTLPPAGENEAAPPVNNLDELTELFAEEMPLWQDILGSQWLVIGVAVVGVAAISVLLVMRKRSRVRVM
jgi:subtilase family serine protease